MTREEQYAALEKEEQALIQEYLGNPTDECAERIAEVQFALMYLCPIIVTASPSENAP